MNQQDVFWVPLFSKSEIAAAGLVELINMAQ